MSKLTLVDAGDLFSNIYSYMDAAMILMGDDHPGAKGLGIELLEIVAQKAAEAAKDIQGK